LGIGTVLVPAAWLVSVVALEQFGQQGVALGVAWLSVFPLMLAVPAGLVGTVILAVLAAKAPRIDGG